MGEAHVPMKAHAGAQPPWGEALGDNEAETQVGREGGRRGEAKIWKNNVWGGRKA